MHTTDTGLSRPFNPTRRVVSMVTGGGGTSTERPISRQFTIMSETGPRETAGTTEREAWTLLGTAWVRRARGRPRGACSDGLILQMRKQTSNFRNRKCTAARPVPERTGARLSFQSRPPRGGRGKELRCPVVGCTLAGKAPATEQQRDS